MQSDWKFILGWFALWVGTPLLFLGAFLILSGSLQDRILSVRGYHAYDVPDELREPDGSTARYAYPGDEFMLDVADFSKRFVPVFSMIGADQEEVRRNWYSVVKKEGGDRDRSEINRARPLSTCMIYRNGSPTGSLTGCHPKTAPAKLRFVIKDDPALIGKTLKVAAKRSDDLRADSLVEATFRVSEPGHVGRPDYQTTRRRITWTAIAVLIGLFFLNLWAATVSDRPD